MKVFLSQSLFCLFVMSLKRRDDDDEDEEEDEEEAATVNMEDYINIY